jgi:hypothetical protein
MVVKSDSVPFCAPNRSKRYSPTVLGVHTLRSQRLTNRKLIQMSLFSRLKPFLSWQFGIIVDGKGKRIHLGYATGTDPNHL